MLDIQFVRDNPDVVERSAKAKGVEVDIKELLKLDDDRRDAIAALETLQQKQNELVKSLGGKKPSEDQLMKMSDTKAQIQEAKSKLDVVLDHYEEKLSDLPNVIPPDTPEGGEENNREIFKWGETKSGAKDHLQWAEDRGGLIDFEAGAKVAGSKFYFTKGELVMLEQALIQYALNKAKDAGFLPMTVPHLVTDEVASGTGFMPRGEERQIYKIEGDNLNLIATAEMPLTAYHADEILELDKLPINYVGVSPSYRVEAGSYGRHSHGLYRVHQFNKVELYTFAHPDKSEEIHEEMMALEGEFCQELEIPYRVVRIAAGDLGAPAYKKFDVEYWSPADGQYHELMSCSNVTDYQARRLNIRYKADDGNKMVHTLNGTLMASSRTLIAIIENHQQEDGTIKLPKPIAKIMGREEL